MTKILRHITLALGFMTRLPVRWPGKVETNDFLQALRYIPAAGLVIGTLVALTVMAGRELDPLIGALSGLIIWVALTGGLHLDGLGDVADGIGASHRDTARLLEVMKDPHIGSFGVIVIVLQLLAKLVLLYLLARDGDTLALLGLIPLCAAARVIPLFWARMLPPLGQGLGRMMAQTVQPIDLIGWAVALALFAVIFWPALLIVPVCVVVGRWFFIAKMQGINGDGHGAGIELSESAILATMLLLLLM